MKWNKMLAVILTGAAAVFSAVPALGAEGQPLSWVQETDVSGGSYWMYLDETGQPVRGQSREIDGGTYFFDQEGRMLWDWISRDGEQVDSGSGDGYRNDGVYYCGGQNEGRAVTGWKYILVEDDEGGREKKWFYFRENGRKVSGGSITEHENGYEYRYTFDENGVLVSSKLMGAALGNTGNEGKWLQHTPTASQDPYGDETTVRWYYQRGNGELVKDQMRTIDGETYLFDKTGIMRTGLVLVDGNGRYADTLFHAGDQLICDSEDLKNDWEGQRLMYFDETSGARRRGDVRLEMGDGVYTLSFKQNGRAVHGPYEGRLYDSGIRMEADRDAGYEVKTVDDREYLVNTDGKIQKKGRYKDKDGAWWRVESGSDSKGYVINQE